MKQVTASLIAMAALAASFYSHAQTKGAPPPNSNPQWEAMGIVTYKAENTDRTDNIPPPSRVDQNLANIAWGKEIAANKDMPSTVLLSTVNHNDIQFTFSILSSATAPGCIPPANGKYVTDMYSVCPMKVVSFNGSDKPKSGIFNGYCHLYPFPADKAGEKNETQFWFDKATSTAYFRVVQHGQLVPSCNKAIRVR